MIVPLPEKKEQEQEVQRRQQRVPKKETSNRKGKNAITAPTLSEEQIHTLDNGEGKLQNNSPYDC